MKKFPAVLLALLLLACFSPANYSQTSGQWTIGAVERKRPNLAPAILRTIRTGRHKGFDRVVFEFRGNSVPGYKIEYVDRPVRQCGSGDAERVAGDAFLSVKMTPAQAHTDAGRPTIGYRELRLRLPRIKELQSTCDFEGEVEWVIGVSSPNRYRVLELSNPRRLVIDIRH